MAQTWKNPSASTIFPFSAGLPRYLPMFRHHRMPKLTVKASLIQRSRGVTFPSLDGSLAEPRTNHKPLYVLTHICVFVHTYMCGHRCRYVNILVKIVIYQEKTSWMLVKPTVTGEEFRSLLPLLIHLNPNDSFLCCFSPDQFSTALPHL